MNSYTKDRFKKVGSAKALQLTVLRKKRQSVQMKKEHNWTRAQPPKAGGSEKTIQGKTPQGLDKNGRGEGKKR